MFLITASEPLRNRWGPSVALPDKGVLFARVGFPLTLPLQVAPSTTSGGCTNVSRAAVINVLALLTSLEET